ncbi:carbonic anhydrase [Bradyrhizobium frederickii]|uniref:carbonic anhydrase n=1 Tax=Bradyrhizobium frederickii TaxID=2560054 RepID=UPI001F20381A|nr:carbonic anhydrase [Bradyrhizobium frederickii]
MDASTTHLLPQLRSQASLTQINRCKAICREHARCRPADTMLSGGRISLDHVASHAQGSSANGVKLKKVDITYRYEARDDQPRLLPPDSTAALVRLDGGNREFAALLDQVTDETGAIQRVIPVDPRDLGLLQDSGATPRQTPFAAVVGCSDARVPVELIFNQGPNDLFVIRVAGNGLGPDVLGSLKYATENLGGSLRLIVVLGHSGCGALTAAVDVFLNPVDYLPLATKSSLRNILDRLLIVVQTSAKRLLAAFGPDIAQRPGYRQALIETSIVTNAALAAHSISEFAPNDPSRLKAAYGVYLLETREVWAPRPGELKGTGLAEAPRDLAGFVELGDALVQSERIISFLKSQK